MERLFGALFIVGICFLSYLYGVFSTRFEVFPYRPVREAFVAGRALYELWQDKLAGKPIHVLWFESEMPTPEVLNERAGQELVLVSGGPYALMSHCPELGCLAWIMDRDGAVRHVWPIDPEEPWAELAQVRGFEVEDIVTRGVYVYDNGDLLVSYDARNTFPFSMGMAKFDKDGKLIWKNDALIHHWAFVDDQGFIYAPGHRLIDSPVKLGDTMYTIDCERETIYEDLIVVMNPDGEVIREISVLDSLIDSNYFGLIILNHVDSCDPLHLNEVVLLTEEDASSYPGLSAGDMLISMNAINALAVLDRDTAKVKWLVAGKTSKQHNPRFVGDDGIIALDNRGGPIEKGGSRIVKMNLGSEEFETLFPRSDTPPDVDFHTDVSGFIDLSEDRSRALVSLTMQGRALEIDLRSGDILWQYDDVHDVSSIVEAGSDQRYARFGLNGVRYVGNLGFLSDTVSQQTSASSAR